MSCPQACITPTSWPLYVARTVLLNGTSTNSVTGSAVHVGAQRDYRAGAPATKNADDAVATNSGLHLEPECLEVLRDQRSGSRLLERQLGMLVNVAAPLHDTGRDLDGLTVDVRVQSLERWLRLQDDWNREKDEKESHGNGSITGGRRMY